jgi:hypothetical protein
MVDGTLNSKFIPMTAARWGTEDGVAYVEFDNIASFSSFVYLSTREDEPQYSNGVNLTAKSLTDAVQLNWTTTIDKLNDRYFVERSTNGMDWKQVHQLTSTSSSVEGMQNVAYDFLDTKPVVGKSFYRIKLQPQQGNAIYSKVVAVKYDVNLKFSVSPNPTKDGLVTIKGLKAGSKVSIVNTNGQILHQFVALSPVQIIDLRKQASGVFYVHVKEENQTKQFKVLKID